MSTNNSSTERQDRFRFIYNSLALFAMSYEDLMKLDGPMFDVEFELESEFEIAFVDANINYLFGNKLLSQNIREELLGFKAFIEAIPGPLWKVEEFKTNELWENARARANSILSLLHINDRDYDFSKIKTF